MEFSELCGKYLSLLASLSGLFFLIIIITDHLIPLFSAVITTDERNGVQPATEPLFSIPRIREQERASTLVMLTCTLQIHNFAVISSAPALR